jgi:hypothetical protein
LGELPENEDFRRAVAKFGLPYREAHAAMIMSGIVDVSDLRRSSVKAFVLDTVKDPTKLRDAALILGGVIYLSGYAVWSVLAWLEGLGPVPVLDSQYFVAGLPTLAALAITGALTFAARHLLTNVWPRYVRRFEPRQRRWVQIVSVIVIGVCYSIIVVAFYSPRPHTNWIPLLPQLPWLDALYEWLDREVYSASLWMSQLSGFSTLPDRLQSLIDSVMIFALLFTVAANIELGRRGEPMIQPHTRSDVQYLITRVQFTALRLAVYFFPLVIGWGVLNYYVQDVYTNMPQALGGARARRAVLDLHASEFSATTLEALGVQSPGTATDDWVGTSNELNVRYATDTMIIVEPIRQEPGSVRFFELSRDGVNAVRWTVAARSSDPSP